MQLDLKIFIPKCKRNGQVVRVSKDTYIDISKCKNGKAKNGKREKQG